jgi:NTE family protein
MVFLTDGGVYDNLGVEPVWKHYETVLASDAGRLTDSVLMASQLPLPRLRRAADIGIEQVGAIRRRWMFEQLETKVRKGAMWAIHTRGEKFPLPNKQHYTEPVRLVLNKVRTDLNAFTAAEMACLENQGYCLADGAVRSYAPKICSNLTASFRWPNPDWVEEEKVLKALRKSGSLNILSDLWGQITGRT